MAWTAANKFGSLERTKKNKTAVVISSIAALFFGQLLFVVLVGAVYPYTGYIEIAILILITIVSFRERNILNNNLINL